MPAPRQLTIRSTVDLLAIVPCLIGFHPFDSLVVVAMRGGFRGGGRAAGDSQVVFAARSDLPPPHTSPAAHAELADRLAGVVTRQGSQTAAVIGYGPPDRVAAAVPVTCEALSRRGVAVIDALRVTAGRYFSLLCDDPECCPPDGTAFDTTTSALTAEAVFAGQVVLPDRTALVRQIAAVGGPVRESMRQATARAEDRLASLVTAEPQRAGDRPVGGGPVGGAPAGDGPAGGGPAAAVLRAGKAAVRQALARGESGDRLTDDEVAWLTLLLCHQQVRDFAWERTTPDEWQIALWTEVLRRAEPYLAPAPASLLAFAAWRAGFGSLASVAIERALGADPAYPMALLLDDMLRHGAPPSILDDWPIVARGRRRRRRPGRGRRAEG